MSLYNWGEGDLITERLADATLALHLGYRLGPIRGIDPAGGGNGGSARLPRVAAVPVDLRKDVLSEGRVPSQILTAAVACSATAQARKADAVSVTVPSACRIRIQPLLDLVSCLDREASLACAREPWIARSTRRQQQRGRRPASGTETVSLYQEAESCMNQRAPVSACAVILVFVGALVACSNPPTGPGPTTLRLELTGPSTVAPGQLAEYRLVAVSANGSTRDVSLEAEWRSSIEAVIAIAGPGRAAVQHPGEAVITAVRDQVLRDRRVPPQILTTAVR
jgi:hypothetical protein